MDHSHDCCCRICCRLAEQERWIRQLWSATLLIQSRVFQNSGMTRVGNMTRVLVPQSARDRLVLGKHKGISFAPQFLATTFVPWSAGKRKGISFAPQQSHRYSDSLVIGKHKGASFAESYHAARPAPMSLGKHKGASFAEAYHAARPAPMSLGKDKGIVFAPSFFNSQTSQWALAKQKGVSFATAYSGTQVGYAGTAVDAGGGSPWSNVGNATGAPDAAFADCPIGPGLATTGFLGLEHYGFSVPALATIVGVQVDVSVQELSGVTSSIDQLVQLLLLGAGAGTNKATGASLPTTEGIMTYGGPTDLWGMSLTPVDVNQPAFGVELAYNNGSGVLAADPGVDAVKITVFYTL